MDAEYIFLRAKEIDDPAVRSAFVEGACRGDGAKRAEVEVLLAVRQEVAGPTAPPDGPSNPAETVDAAGLTETPGTVIGRYKILEKIGEGGMAVVYVAEQHHPIRRRVALKIIKPGMDTKQVIARFEAERQALALMDHPNIARVLDAGATEAGRPYFVMELVRGIPITQYCDQEKLRARDRLDLFIQVCRAIQHAHQKGIIHRDIKPSNVMVTLHDGAPVPKVIDFGIAKATQQELTERTVYTQFQQFIGTPAYMSPEQAEMSGLDIDTRSDIYSLGVLLYELLTGSTPFDTHELMQSGLDQMRKIIREREPYRPSTKVGTLSAEDRTTTALRQSTEVPKLISVLRGDLDWVVMKCLEKDRTRRYDTADALAMDLKRHLNDEPVVARPPSTVYRLQKAWRRNKVVHTAAFAVLVTSITGFTFATWGWGEARQQREEAVRARTQEKTQRVEAEQNERRAIGAERIAHQRAYASDMNLAVKALHSGNLGRAEALLNRQRPRPGETDLRGWEWRYLWQQIRSDALSVLCRKSEIESLAVSADGRWLGIGLAHRDGVFVWDLLTRQEVAWLARGEHEVQLTFSPTEPLLAFTARADEASGARTTLYLWHAVTRQFVREHPLEGDCTGLAFSEDGQKLAASVASWATSGGEITVWRVSDGARLSGLRTEQRYIRPATGFAATSDLSVAAYGTAHERLRVVDLVEGRELWSAVASDMYITALAFSRDGKTLASAAGFGASDIRLWNVATGQQIGRLEGHGGSVFDLLFWPDGRRLASASTDQTIRIWDLPSQTCLDVLRGHRNEVWRLALLPDKRTLVSGAKDGVVCLWDTSVAHPRRQYVTWSDPIWTWCFASDARAILTLDFQGQVARWSGADFQTKEPLLEVGQMPASIDYLYNLFSPDGRFLACGSEEGTLSVWDLSRPGLWRRLEFGTGRVIPLCFLASGSRLVGARVGDDRLIEWDLETNREVQSWPAPLRFDLVFNATAHSPVSEMLIAAGAHGDTCARDLGRQSNTPLALDVLEAAHLAFDRSGRWLAAASLLGYARVWNTETWQEEVTLGGFLNAVTSVAFSSDGTRLIAGAAAANEAVKLWSTDSWQELLALQAEGHLFNQARISPDGEAIGVVTQLGCLYVWQAPTWDEIEAIEANRNNSIR